MDNVKENLKNWQESQVKSISVGGLFSRNSVVYKWKAPFRCWILREAAFWRLTDLLSQSLILHEQGHGLGARILLRSGFETVATLIYLNHKMKEVIDENLDFHQFCALTIRLVLGSKNEMGPYEAINVVTMIDKGNKKYPGLRKTYDGLSESAHPNFEGQVWGYSKVDHDEFETNFSNRWMKLCGERHFNSMELCMMTFYHEYDVEWVKLINELEKWVEKNDATLEATKDTS